MTIASGFIWHSFLKQDSDAIVLYVGTEDDSASILRFGAIEAPLSDAKVFNKYLQNLDKEKHYYVYSKKGLQGEKACRLMEEAGFNETINLDGGIINFALSS